MVTSRNDRSENAHIVRQEQDCAFLGANQKPTVRALQSRAAYLRRARIGGDPASLDALVASLKRIALAAGV